MFFAIFFVPFFVVTILHAAIIPDTKSSSSLIAQYHDRGISFLKSGKLLNLDPLVGDTACQIRAVYFADLYTKVKKNLPLDEKESDALAYGLLLTDIKKYEGDRSPVLKESLDKKKLGLSNKEADKLIKKARNCLAELSVGYVQLLAKALPEEESPSFVKALSEVAFIESKPIVACYPGMRTLMHHIKKQGMHLVIRYDTVATLNPFFTLGFSLIDGKYVKTDIHTLNTESVAIVFDVLVSHVPLAYTGSVEQMIIMQAAMHQQFAGKENSGRKLPYEKLGISTIENEYVYLLNKASEMNISRANPDPFYIDHIHVATIGELIAPSSTATASKEESL